jgi:histidyl-tRNA synthetase
MADKQSTKPPAGTRDFLPDDIRRREYVMGAVREVYERYGFEPLETPAFENIETLLGKYGEEGNKLIFKILKRGEHESTGEADLALRYDLTVPLARVVAQYQNELPRLFKRYQIQPVWRADRPARGRFREFYQCDLDAMGSTSPVVEVEQLAAVSDVLTTLGFQDFRIRLNHRRLLPVILTRHFEIASEADQALALVALDKLDKIGHEGVANEFAQKGLTTREQALEGLKRALDSPALRPLREPTLEAPQEGLKHAIAPPFSKESTQQAALQGLRDARPPSSEQAVIRETQEILLLSEHTPAAGKIVFDPFLARGLSYYTGAIMEASVPDLAGSLGGGGRYDNLIGMFLGRDVPACGFSLGLERIIVVMSERGMFPPTVTKGAIDVVVTFMDDDSRAEALRLATELRATKLRVDVFPESSRKFDKPLKYSSARGARTMAIFGENERARGEVSIRDLHTREQQAVPRDQAPAVIARLLATST